MKFRVQGRYDVILDIPNGLTEDQIDDYISDETIDAIYAGTRSSITFDSVFEI